MIKIVSNSEEANCITHNGTMHADEVFATAFLEMYLGDIKVFRTTGIDNLKINENTLIYDVGRGKFDHHQVNATKRDNGITYCSLGLLWKEFGRDFLKQYGITNIEKVFLGIDKDLIEGIDADDNGIFPKIEADYKVKTISNIIKLFNPGFHSNQDESTQFLKAVEVSKKILQEEIVYINGKVTADEIINNKLESIDENTKYLILDEFIPYEETILNNPKANNLLFVAFPSNRGGYAIKTIAKSIEDKTARMSFPEEWAGLQDEELEKASSIKDIKFCHLGRFIVTTKTMTAVTEVLDKLCN
jgi:uncharacterized UPF0160 family protein